MVIFNLASATLGTVVWFLFCIYCAYWWRSVWGSLQRERYARIVRVLLLPAGIHCPLRILIELLIFSHRHDGMDLILTPLVIAMNLVCFFWYLKMAKRFLDNDDWWRNQWKRLKAYGRSLLVRPAATTGR